MVNSKNMMDYIMDYECGTLNDKQTLELFSHLIQSGMAWSLQGHYGRTANSLMSEGFIDKNGKIDWEEFDYHKLL